MLITSSKKASNEPTVNIRLSLLLTPAGTSVLLLGLRKDVSWKFPPETHTLWPLLRTCVEREKNQYFSSISHSVQVD